MNKMKVLLLCLLLLLSGALQAETRYVTDILKVTMRSGESSSHRILRMLNSGTSVEVLESNSESGYSKIRTSGGQIGYVLNRQLMVKPSARSQLTSMEQQLQELQEAPGKLSSKLADLQQQHKALQAAHKELMQIKKKLDSNLQNIQRTASSAIRISNERNELRTQVKELTRQVGELKQENRDLSNKATRDWFLIGAGVIIAGILIGLILPHLRFQRRRNEWGSL
ncbi:MAG: TIGR04211 family SH3 domain-containing protein [gamma proteobacterium endosymbiont of Lamellibrachia anaximandri]|nr:TIGR04211 family SH3 domain-containing protein [gamma proteobacterium endosymbiont of Lamellibrachia anaximandri]MBL3533104.1 TIGR04211 family SH3 domain-containing protein [gamma proteobacterium endosymbiont of Lamellibrachia anaximandri]MBL3600335.1 TIGR04211 family SH3 domain-containing protein [gamma proteobacterium endosymbiont of Lamellibrachia anaximandri]